MPCPVGAEDLHTVDDIVAGVQGMRRQATVAESGDREAQRRCLGFGQRVWWTCMGCRCRAPRTRRPRSPSACSACSSRPNRSPSKSTWRAFEKHGGIVEERITGVALTSPSVQMRALPDGTVELLSTHDQLLGGASGQKYLGCVFPADPGYAALDRRTCDGDRAAPREARRARAVRGRLRRRPGRERRVDAVCDRAEPPQGRHHPPVPDSAIPHRRQLRR